MKYENWVKLLISIIICEFAGVIGSGFTVSQIGGWYGNLKKPFFNPPNFIFGPVWTTLFVLMGISFYLVWNEKFAIKNEFKKISKKSCNKWSKKFFDGPWKKANIILIFAVQLVLNVLWSVIFFGLHSPVLAFFELLMLWFAILFTIVNFYRVSKKASLLLIPYILWVTFAGFLNFFIWILN